MNKNIFVYMALFLSLAANSAIAAGGLDNASSLIADLISWASLFVVGVASASFLWKLGMAVMDLKPWGDVIMGLVYVGLTGGASLGITWASGWWG